MADLKNVIYLSNEDYETLVTTGTVTINGDTLTYDETNNIYVTPEETASSTHDGLMSVGDKVKLDGIAPGADVDTNQTVKVGDTAFEANDAVNFVGTAPVTVAGNSTNKTITIGVTTGTTAGTVATGNHNHDSDYVTIHTAQEIDGQKTIKGQTRIKGSAAASSADNTTSGFTFWKSTTSSYSKTSEDYLGLISANDSGALGIYGRTALYFRPVITNGSVDTSYGVTMNNTGLFPGSNNMPLGNADHPWNNLWVNNLKNGSYTLTFPAKSGTIATTADIVADTNQKVKVGDTTFGANDVVDITGGGIVSVTGNTTTKTINISAAETTYTFAEGTTDKAFTVTPSGGSAQTVPIHGLGGASLKNYTTSVTQNSDDLVTSGAVFAAIDLLPEPMVFKGTLGTNGTVTSLPTAAVDNEGWTYKVITAGTYASQSAKVGDVFTCAELTTDTYSWVLIPAGDEEDTWRNIKVNGTELLGTAISTGAVNFKNGANVTITGSGNDVTIASSYEDHNQTVKGNGTAFGADAVVNIVGGGATTVTADTTNNKITISTPSVTDTNQTVKVGSTTFGADDAVDFVAGTNITSITADAAAKTITINAKDTTYDDATTSASGLMSAADKTKLEGIASGAEVNVQADWDVTDSSSDAFIKNRPTIPTVNNGTLTIQGNGTAASTFTANQSGNTTLNIKGSGKTTVTKSADNEITISSNADNGNADKVDSMHMLDQTYAYMGYLDITIGCVNAVVNTGLTESQIFALTGNLYGKLYLASDTGKYWRRKNTQTTASASNWRDDTAVATASLALPNQLTTTEDAVYVRLNVNQQYYSKLPKFFVTASYDNTSGSTQITGFCRKQNNFEITSCNYNGNNLIGIYQESANTDKYIFKFSKFKSSYGASSELSITLRIYYNEASGTPTITFIGSTHADYNTVKAYSYCSVPDFGIKGTAIYDTMLPRINTANLGSASNPWSAVYGKTLYENGTALANKYLGKTAKAADSDKLDGYDYTYFQAALPTTSTAGKVLKSTSTEGTVEWGDVTSGPTTYLKTASVSGNILTITKQDDSQVTFTDTTYESKTAASGGTDVSLVTTGEKYTWNNKSDLAIGTTSSTASAGNHTHSFTPSGSVTLTNTGSSGTTYVESITSTAVTGSPTTRYLHWSAGTTPKSGATPNHTSTNTGTATTITGLTTKYLTVSRGTSGSGTSARRTLTFTPAASSTTAGAAMNMTYIESGTSSTHTHTYDKTTSVSLTAGTAPSLTANSTPESALATYLQEYSVSGGGATATTKCLNATFNGDSGTTGTPQ